MSRVLIIDSVDSDAALLKQFFSDFSLDVQIENSAKSALASSKDNAALVVIAVELSDTNGFVLFSRMKRLPQLSSVPMWITSSESTEAVFEQHRRLALHADGYFKKPLDMQALESALRDIFPDLGVKRGGEEELMFDMPDFMPGFEEEELFDLDESSLHSVLDEIEERELQLDLSAGKLYDNLEISDESASDSSYVDFTPPSDNVEISGVSKFDVSRGISEEELKMSASQTTEFESFTDELDTLRLIEKTQQETIDRQSDEISHLKGRLKDMENKLSLDNSSVVVDNARLKSDLDRSDARLAELESEFAKHREKMQAMHRLLEKMQTTLSELLTLSKS